jgi:uncharacterized membrane protein YgdD (TMEM256/DUF423 family)
MKIIRENDKYYLLQQDKKLEFTGEALKMIIVYEALTVLDVAKNVKFETCYINNNTIFYIKGITVFTGDLSYFFKDCEHFLKESKNVLF